jgi:hypothetical protein
MTIMAIQFSKDPERTPSEYITIKGVTLINSNKVQEILSKNLNNYEPRKIFESNGRTDWGNGIR